MVSNLSLCIASGLALCQPNQVSEEVTTQKHYSLVDSFEIEEMVQDILAPTSYSREIAEVEVVEYINGYYDYVEEQERLEQERIAEEQRRLEEEQRRLAEEERQRELGAYCLGK